MNTKTVFTATICLLLFSGIILSSCAKKITLHNVGIAPAAQAYAKIKKEKTNNYSVELKAKHLAPSMNLNPPKKTYVVWMMTEYNGIKNIGQFQSGTGFLSKTLKGSIKTITPYKPTGFFITAENDAAISFPGYMVILKSN